MLSKKFQNEMLFLTELFFYYEMQFYMILSPSSNEAKDFILDRMGFFFLAEAFHLFIYTFI